MADRYWVGGSASWDGTAGTKWSATNGGAGGASVPTSADDVFFTSLSGAGTVTIAAGNTGAKSINCTGFTGTLTGTAGITVSGSFTLSAGMTFTYSGTLTLAQPGTLTSAGKTFSGILFIQTTQASSAISLGDAFTSTNRIEFGLGTFNSANFNISATQLLINNSNGKTINLGSSTVTLSGTAPISFSIISNLTFNAGSSSIICTNSSASITSGTAESTGITYNNVSFTNTTVSSSFSINGRNTFNNISVAGPTSAAGTSTLTFDSSQTINGTLSTTGTAGNRRVFISSNTFDIQRRLIVNSTPNLTDVDFRDIIVEGSAAPIGGTRIGDRGECRGISFSAPKTVYYNPLSGNLWTGNSWASISSGVPNTDNFPLPQDTAIIDNASISSIFIDGTLYLPNVDFSARTTAITASLSGTPICYGNWITGSGVTYSGTGNLTFQGSKTRSITSAGKTFTFDVTIDSIAGTVRLNDALNTNRTLTVTNGTFDTNNFNVTASSLSSSNSNIRTINLRSSTVTLNTASSAINFGQPTGLTFNAGTSNIICNISSSGTAGVITAFRNAVFYNVTFNLTTAGAFRFAGTISGSNFTAIPGRLIFNNLTISRTSTSQSNVVLVFDGDAIINGTLSCSGLSPIRRCSVFSNLAGVQRTLTVNNISADDCDFRDIVLTGAAAGAAPTRAGDCGNNSGIIFPAPKTVYWNLTGSNTPFSSNGWATSSGGTPDINNFPLAQDTIIFDNAATGTGIQFDVGWNIGTLNASNRTNAFSFNFAATDVTVYGDWLFGTGTTTQDTVLSLSFAKNGTQTITSNGQTFRVPVTVNNRLANVVLADAISLSSNRTLSVVAGSFDAVTYNVTAGAFSLSGMQSGATIPHIVRMGSGTWTLSGTGTVWNVDFSPVRPILICGTSTIVLSNTTTTARTFAGGINYYNKLTIGGATGTSTTTISGASAFGELASTKTVAHTILFQSGNTQTIGKWSVTGTAGNLVTIGPASAATTYTLSFTSPNSGIDYLSVSYCVVSSTSPSEFYVGPNSTNTAGNSGPIFFTAPPTPRTLYWVGGTGNWSSTTKWSTSSGGASGAAIPTSLDSVVFDAASNATAYTATIDIAARCAAFTMSGPTSGNVTLAGTSQLAVNGNMTFSSTGITRTYTGTILLCGNSNYTLTTNGLGMGAITVFGIGSTWTLGSSLTISQSSAQLTFTYGSFNTSLSNFSVTCHGHLQSDNNNLREVIFNGSTVTTASGVTGGSMTFNWENFLFNAGTSTITTPNGGTSIRTDSYSSINSNGLTFYNFTFSSTTHTSTNILGKNTFNTLTLPGRTNAGMSTFSFFNDQTIQTLTVNPGTSAGFRTFLNSSAIGTQRTLTVTTFSAGASDIDFRDIAIVGSASPISPVRAGDCKGNSGITFPAPKTVYWNLAAGGSLSSTAWSLTSGGSVSDANFPLPQDTAIIQNTGLNSGQTVTINGNYNVGTIDSSARTLAFTLNANWLISVYGNWLNGSGATITGGQNLTFCGRTNQTIRCEGKSFPQTIVIDTPGGNVTQQDAFTTTSTFQHVSGNYSANNFNFTGSTLSLNSSNIERTLAIGDATWTLSGTGSTAVFLPNAGLTVTGNGRISMNASSAKTIIPGTIDLSNITLNQAGSGTLTLNNSDATMRFRNITNSFADVTSITFTGGTVTFLTSFLASGSTSKVLTVASTNTTQARVVKRGPWYIGASSVSTHNSRIYQSGGGNIDFVTANYINAHTIPDVFSPSAGFLSFF